MGLASTGDTITEESAAIARTECTFFNPAQKLNRDLSVAVIRECFKDRGSIRILDAMSATGLRGIRYLKEIDNCVVFMNDISRSSVESIRANLLLNGVSDAEYLEGDLSGVRAGGDARAKVVRSDCNVLMAATPCFFDVVDIDPFGSCSEYIDNAIRAVRHGGLLCLTATDKAVLCSNEKKCLVKYSTSIARGLAMNEVALRTIVSLVSRQASKFDCSVQPVASLSVDFYARVFLRVLRKNPRSVIESNSHVLMCVCHNFVEIGPGGRGVDGTCCNCGKAMKLCGPFWNGALHDLEAVDGMLGQASLENRRLVGILRYLRQELPTMFYYEVPRLCSALKIRAIGQSKLLHGLANMGYRVSYTHAELDAIKTDAPIGVINKVLLAASTGDEDVLREIGARLDGNPDVQALEATELFKGLVRSGMGPLPLPRRH